MNETRINLDISLTDPDPYKVVEMLAALRDKTKPSKHLKPRATVPSNGKATKYRAAYATLKSYAKVAKKYGVNVGTVWGAVNRSKK